MDYYNNDYLMHYGVKGMKWGVRRSNKWATSKHQPSSVRSSVLAGVYAATGNKRIGKALDKSNNRDAAKWKRAKEKEAERAEKNTPEAKAARKEKAVKAAKVGVAVAGTALAAYGAYKLHDFVREKNREIRIKEGSDKCDRMLRKLDNMRVNDLVKGSAATESWVKTGKQKTPLQYNNNGKTITIPKQYRNTASTLKPTQYRNIENKVIDKTMNEAFDKAKNDSFRTAAKNVYDYYRKNRKR